MQSTTRPPLWLLNEDVIKGVTVSREEVDAMYDWKNNPIAALPNWLCLVGRK